MEERLAERKKQFKKGGGGLEEARRAREDETVQIRKKEREEQLARRRKLEGEEGGISVGGGGSGSGPSATTGGGSVGTAQQSVVLQQCLDQIVQAPALEAKLEGVRAVRKMLSMEKNAPIQRVIELGFIPYLMEMLSAESFPELQFEAAWALTNVASGTAEQTRVVVESGGIEGFVALLSSRNLDVVEQAIWGLGNISGDNVGYRNKILEMRPLEKLVVLLRHTEKLSVTRNITWCIGNMCRGKPGCNLDLVRGVLPVLVNLLHHPDNEVVADAAWALGYVSDGANDRIQAVIEAGGVVKLVELLAHSSALLVTPALRAIGNIVTGDEAQTDLVIRCGAVPQLLCLLSHTRKNIRKEACWAVSNITAGNTRQIQTVIHAGIFPKLIDILVRGEFDLKKEAVWGVCNAMSEGSLDQIKYITELGVMAPLVSILKVRDTRMILVILEALAHIFDNGDKLVDRGDYPENPYLRLFEEADGLDICEDLQLDDNEEVYLKAVAIIARFPSEEIPPGAAVGPLPGTTGNGGFNF